MSDKGNVVVFVEMDRQFRIPIDVLGETEDDEDLKDRAEDFFWSHWGEFLANEPAQKADIEMTHAAVERETTQQGEDQ